MAWNNTYLLSVRAEGQKSGESQLASLLSVFWDWNQAVSQPDSSLEALGSIHFQLFKSAESGSLWWQDQVPRFLAGCRLGAILLLDVIPTPSHVALSISLHRQSQQQCLNSTSSWALKLSECYLYLLLPPARESSLLLRIRSGPPRYPFLRVNFDI